MTKPRIFQDSETVSELDTFESVMVEARALKPGMILLDPELGTPFYAIDHRKRSTPRSGQLTWLVEVLDGTERRQRGRYTDMVLSPGRMVPVAAR